MWDIIICDHDSSAAKELGDKVEELHIPQLHQIHLYTSGQALLDEITDQRVEPALVIMDIRLGEENGIETAGQIQKLRPPCQIIFTSEDRTYPEEIYEVEHVYFLVKPVRMESLDKAVKCGIRRLRILKEECLYIRNKSGDFVIPMDEIYSLEKEKRKIVVRTVSGEACSFYGKFEDVEGQLKQTFVRCHHSFIVNMYRVKTMGKDFFILWDDRKIPISRTYVKQVHQEFEQYARRSYDGRKSGAAGR